LVRSDTSPHETKGDPRESADPEVHGAFAAVVEALNVASDMTACDPLGGVPRRKTTGPFRVSASGHPALEPVPDRAENY